MNPNFLLNMPKMPVVISEDCNVPALRSIRHYEGRGKTARTRGNAQSGRRISFLKKLIAR